jgi:hypothetical protein
MDSPPEPPQGKMIPDEGELGFAAPFLVPLDEITQV